MADPAGHVFNDKLFIYPSHDRQCDNVFDDDGGHFHAAGQGTGTVGKLVGTPQYEGDAYDYEK